MLDALPAKQLLGDKATIEHQKRSSFTEAEPYDC
jgi:hypothetical protein